MTTPPWYVITGGPCAGKTTLVAELGHRGYRTVNEPARNYIETELGKGRTLEDIRADEVAFQHALVPIKIAVEETTPRNETVFFDRGMHDSPVYLELAGGSSFPTLEQALQASSYARVFLPDLLPLVADGVRTENEAQAKELHERLRRVYEDAGMEVTTVPVMSVAERADFILAHI